MAVRGLKVGSVSISEHNHSTLRGRKRSTASYENPPLLKASISSHFDYGDQLVTFRKEFKERQAKIQPSPQIEPLDFNNMPILGVGKFGTVRLMKMDDGGVCAVKILLKENVVKENVVEKTFMEKTVLSAARFPFIVSLLFLNKDNDYLYFGLPFVGGSDLFAYHRKRLKFSEPMARFYTGQILLALEYLHNVNCLYRDLKLENILIEVNGYIKLTDFGLSKFVENRTTTLCGTPEYLAPEMLQVQPYGYSVDWWTFGILLFELVAGNTPFFKYSSNLNRMYAKICKGEFEIPVNFSAELKGLVEGLLDVRVATRLGNLCNGTNDIKSHPFFRVINWRGLLAQNIPAPYKPHLLHPADTTYFSKIISSKYQVIMRRSTVDLYSDIFADF